jgi:NADH-quinone oxidoreductase subunit E
MAHASPTLKKKRTLRGKRTASAKIDRIVDENNGHRGALIATLHDIQARHGYLPEEALRRTAERSGVSLVDVYGVATFYRSFRLSPTGTHTIRVCLGTACHVRGAPRVVEEFERRLGIPAGETTDDGEFTLETVNCLGACALGPIVVVDGRYHSNVRPGQVEEILEKTRQTLEIDGEADIDR